MLFIEFLLNLEEPTASHKFRRIIREAGITRKIRDDQAKFLAFVCSSDSETMKKIYDEGRWQAWVDANISFMQKTFGKENVVACAHREVSPTSADI